MSVAARIESMMGEFSLAEEKLAKYILQNLEKVPTMTASDLAEAAGSSAPTVVRFSKKIGFHSLTDFKISVSTELQTGISEEFSDIEPNESFYSVKNKLGKNAQIAINETIEILEEDLTLQVVTAIEQASTIYVYGVGASALVVEDILQKWSRVGKRVIFETDMHILLPQLANEDQDKLLWLVSNSGKSHDILALASMAKELNVKILSLTQFGTNPLTKFSDLCIQTSRPRETTYRSAATNSLLAQFATIDIIFYMYMSRHGHLTEQVVKTRKVIQKYFERFKKI